MKEFTIVKDLKKRKTKLWQLVLILLSVVLTVNISFAQVSYCSPSFSMPCMGSGFGMINDFVIADAGINHTGSGCSPDGYGDFTAETSLKGSFYQGETYDFSAVLHSMANYQTVRIWIDFNEDGEFDEDGELVFSFNNNSDPFNSVTGTITIPITAPITSSTRLRIFNFYGDEQSPCQNDGLYGEAHDYTIAILAASSSVDYCTPSFSMPCMGSGFGMINDFVIADAGINHTGSGCSPDGYGDFTAETSLKGSFYQGETYDFSAVLHSMANYQTVKIWIDFNEDGEFDEDGELVFSFNNNSDPFNSVTGTITIPTTAPITSSTRLRIFNFYGDEQSPCQNDGLYGEAHDYTIEILSSSCLIQSTLFENFDNYPLGSIVPNCWERIIIGNEAIQEISSETPASGTRNILQYSTNTSFSIVILPEFNNINSGTHRLRFKARVTGGTGILEVGYITNITDESTFTVVESLTINNNNYSDSDSEYIIVFSTLIPSDSRIAIKNPGISSVDHFWDNVYWEEIPSCIAPTELNVANITPNTATLNWTSDGTLFEIEYGISGFVQGGGNSTEITEISNYSQYITGLEPNTEYQFYVRNVCSIDNESPWTGPFTFATTCLAVDTLFEDFNSITGIGFQAFPDCWDILTGTGGQAAISTSEGSMVLQQGSGESIVILPDVTNINTNTHWLRFHAKRGGVSNQSLIVGYITDITDVNSFIAISSINITETNFDYVNNTTEHMVAYPSTATGRLAIKRPATGISPGVYWDNIYWEEKLNCPPPANLTITNITQNTADLSWTSDGDIFDIEYGYFGFVKGTGTLISEATNSYVLNGLNPSTSYQYYVLRTDCEDNDETYWAGPFGFTTLCGSVNSITENFDIYGLGSIVPLCWDRIISGTGSQTIVSTSPIASGNRQIRQQSSNPSNATIVVLPQVDNINAGTHWLRFKARVASGIGNLQVGYITDITDASTFIEVTSITISNTDYSSNNSEYTTPFLSDTPSNVRIAIRNPGLSNVQHFWDDVHWEIAPSCMYPLGLSATNISQSSTRLEWNSDGNLFDIEYSTVDFTLGEGEAISGVTNPYILTELAPGVIYQYYVRQVCDENDETSNWTGPFEFKAGTYPENIPTILNVDPQPEDNACTIIPFGIEVPEGQQIANINVKYTMLSSSSAWTSQQRSVLYSPTLGIGENEVVGGGNVDFPGYIEYNRNISFANGATGVIEFELKAWRIAGGTDCGTDLIYVMTGSWILTPEFEPIPTCPNPPSDLAYTNITEDTVDLIWATPEEGTFQIQWGILGFNPHNSGNTISDIISTSYTLQGLDSSILYEFYVRRDCSTEDGEDYGEWVGPVNFNAGYCIPFTSGEAYYFTQFNTTNAIENITFSHPSGSPLGTGYKNQTDMIISQEAGASFGFTSNYIGGASGLRIWIDWNNNFIFEDSEQIFYLGNGSGSKSGTITIPEGTEPGNYRMRIRAQQAAESVPPACGTINTGEAIDFTLNIPCDEVTVPTGNTEQDFEQGDTLADLDVTGDNLVWYANSELTEILEETTLLIDETTYYIVSIDGNCQSDVLAITVSEVLSTSDFTKFGFGYQPNPISEILYLKSNTEISKVIVFNIVGQQLKLPIQANNTQIDMSGLPSGNYIVNVTIEGVNKTFKIVKQ